MANFSCQICHKQFTPKDCAPSHLKRSVPKFCSRKCFGESQKGKILSIKTRTKISQSKKGAIAWNKGTKGIMKPNITSFKKGENMWLGRKHTEEAKRKMSKARIGKYSKDYYKKMGKLGNQKSWSKERRDVHIRSILRGLFKRPTSLEQQMMTIIQKYNLPYKYVGNGAFLIGFKNPDFVNINGEKKLIEVANTFHHNKDYSQKRAEYFEKWGWTSYIFRMDELNEKEILKKLEIK